MPISFNETYSIYTPITPLEPQSFLVYLKQNFTSLDSGENSGKFYGNVLAAVLFSHVHGP